LAVSDQNTAPAGLHELEQRSLEHLNGEIRRCLLSYASANGVRRNEFFRQLVWAETMRETLHAVPAPKRRRA
jgi:hypothetical protein